MNFIKNLPVILMLVLISPVVWLPLSYGEEQAPGEFEMKAAFLYNIAKFIEWPLNPDEQDNDLTICVSGKTPFSSALDSISGKMIRGKEIIVKRNFPAGAMKKCDILFIPGHEKTKLDSILKNLKNLPILTVGDTEFFADKGVMINFYVENDRVRFEINTEAAKRTGLRIHSNLLRLGKIIPMHSDGKRNTNGFAR